MAESSVRKNLDMELQAAEEPAKLIRVVCRVKKHAGDVPSCIKEMTTESVHIWSVGNPNIAPASSKKRKHNKSAKDILTASNAYAFDRVYGTNTTQQQFYEGEVHACVSQLLAGTDSTIFAYGNTNSGKSYTIFGQAKGASKMAKEGILFRVVKDIFKQTGDGVELKISAFEIYNEKVFDLLVSGDLKERPELKWRTLKNRPVRIEGLQTFTAKSQSTAETLLMNTAENRTIAETSLNNRSSRSHCVFTLQLCKEGKAYSKLVVVDLAGSERATRTKATGSHLKEANNINQSLMTLNRCLRIMRENQDRSAGHKQFVPFRDSKLTGFFQHNLTNPKCGPIIMVVNINPDLKEHSETLSVLENSSIAKDVTYEKPPGSERPRRTAARYDLQGRKVKTKKQRAAEKKALAAESKRIVDAATASKDHCAKKCRLATSQNIEQEEGLDATGTSSASGTSTASGGGGAAPAPSSASASASAAETAEAVAAAVAKVKASSAVEIEQLREKIREEVVNEYRATMQKVMHAQLMKAQLKTDEAIADVEALWATRLQDLEAEHAREIAELQNRDIDDKDTLHIEIDGLTTQKMSLREQLGQLREENQRLREKLQQANIEEGDEEDEEEEEEEEVAGGGAAKADSSDDNDEEEDDDDDDDDEEEEEEEEEEKEVESVRKKLVFAEVDNTRSNGPRAGQKRNSSAAGHSAAAAAAAAGAVDPNDENAEYVEKVVPVPKKRYNLRKRS